MSRCKNCRYATLNQFACCNGFWLCFHPYRGELDNRGQFSYPKIESPNITIVCFEPDADPDEALSAAQTPKWCYYEAVARSKKEQPGFDPAKQRKSLEWPFVNDPYAEASGESSQGDQTGGRA